MTLTAIIENRNAFQLASARRSCAGSSDIATSRTPSTLCACGEAWQRDPWHPDWFGMTRIVPRTVCPSASWKVREVFSGWISLSGFGPEWQATHASSVRDTIRPTSSGLDEKEIFPSLLKMRTPSTPSWRPTASTVSRIASRRLIRISWAMVR